MLQIENEYGSFGNDKNYLEELRKLWKQNGINGPFFTADGPTAFMLEAGNIDGAAIGLDSGGSDNDFEQAKKRNPLSPSPADKMPSTIRTTLNSSFRNFFMGQG